MRHWVVTGELEIESTSERLDEKDISPTLYILSLGGEEVYSDYRVGAQGILGSRKLSCDLAKTAK